MSEKQGKQHVILCEGFDDRSFWAGWLLHLGCDDPTDRGKKEVQDAWGRPAKGKGKYFFHTPAGSGVLVQPFEGKANTRKAAREYLRGQVYRPERLILNLDSDAENGSGESARDVVRGIVEHYGGETKGAVDGPFHLGEVQISSVIWECDDADPTPGVPPKQTLERLVAASIRAAYPDRGPVVDSWLAAEPLADVTHKNYGYSYLAKWYAEHGADDFFRVVWRTEAVAEQLRRRLKTTGAWATVESLAAD